MKALSANSQFHPSTGEAGFEAKTNGHRTHPVYRRNLPQNNRFESGIRQLRRFPLLPAGK